MLQDAADSIESIGTAGADRLDQEIAVGRLGLAQRQDQRQRDLALAQIITQILAQGLALAGIVEPVIGDLECLSNGEAEVGQVLLEFGIASGQHGTKP